jgi:hypothetical protein
MLQHNISRKIDTNNKNGRHILMTNNTFRFLVVALSFVVFSSVHAQEDVSDLRQALDELRGEYEQRISDLEKKLEMAVESKSHDGQTDTVKSSGGRAIKSNAFQPVNWCGIKWAI